MASYSYIRDLKDEDLAPPDVHVYTKKELWENWWDYNLKWVLLGIGAFALLVYFICDAYVFNTAVDYQLVIVSPDSIYDTTLDEISETLTPYLDDVTGDGVVNLEVYSYQVDLSTYDIVTEVTGDAEEIVEEVVEETEETAEETETTTYDYFSDTSTYEYYMEMAGQVQLSADLELAESVIFILYDPESFQIASSMLCYPDGTSPDDPENVAWEELVYQISDCTIFSDTIQFALGDYYIARRGYENEDDDYVANFEKYQGLWELIIGDAQPYNEVLANAVS
ncbi:MAG: hypothetical protein R3Y06_01525 [Faecalibacterium sp.]